LCLPQCATYLATGNEALSPRGRILLLRQVGAQPLAPAVREAFELCLGCAACVTACPSGIAPDVLDHLRVLAPAPAGWAGPVPVAR
jgi:glycolate oxidase iron-sulfur subunit